MESDDDVVLVVRGDVDVAVETPLINEIERLLSTADRVVIDLSGVGFMDSTGVRILVRTKQRHGDAVVVGRLSAPVRRLFEVAGLEELLMPPPGQ